MAANCFCVKGLHAGARYLARQRERAGVRVRLSCTDPQHRPTDGAGAYRFGPFSVAPPFPPSNTRPRNQSVSGSQPPSCSPVYISRTVHTTMP
jgi:hypothetical protein